MTFRTNDEFTVLIAGTIKPVAQFGGSAKDRRPIAEQILGMIKSPSLKYGDRLPTEQQMGPALGISRPSLREALKVLTLMGGLESRQGGRLTDPSPSRLVAPFNSMLSLADYDVSEHFETRTLVDLELVRCAPSGQMPEPRQGIMKLAIEGGADARPECDEIHSRRCLSSREPSFHH